MVLKQATISNTSRGKEESTYANVNVGRDELLKVVQGLRLQARENFIGINEVGICLSLKETATISSCLCQEPIIPLGFKNVGINDGVVIDGGGVDVLVYRSALASDWCIVK